jgi:hypothetical protein
MTLWAAQSVRSPFPTHLAYEQLLPRPSGTWVANDLFSTSPPGWGALVINTFRLKDTKIINRWNGPDGYRGRAVTAGAGVMVRELYEKVWAADQDVLAGECPVSEVPAHSGHPTPIFPS